jgi:N-acetylneuraminic acid mutarotase
VTPVGASDSKISELPEPVTSFGAATQGNYLYAYGGHTGSAHSYSNEEQFNRLIRWDLSSSGQGNWEELAEGPRVQGNALIAAKNYVVLLGGFNAENATGEKSRLVSQAGVKRYALDKKAWESLPDLPEPRSSMDAAILGDTIYVVGGWSMNGNGSETKWLETAWKLTLRNDGTNSGWQPTV